MMEEKKKSFIRTGIFNAICAVLCAAAATALIYVTVIMMVARVGGYSGMSREAMAGKAMDRISANNMRMLMNGFTVGYVKNTAALRMWILP